MMSPVLKAKRSPAATVKSVKADKSFRVRRSVQGSSLNNITALASGMRPNTRRAGTHAVSTVVIQLDA